MADVDHTLEGTVLGRDGRRYPIGEEPDGEPVPNNVFVYGTPTPGAVPVWNGDLNRWEFGEGGGGSIDETAVLAIVNSALDDWVGAAPSQLNTLLELATALGNDANFASTLTAALAAKAAKAANLSDLTDLAAALAALSPGAVDISYSPVAPLTSDNVQDAIFELQEMVTGDQPYDHTASGLSADTVQAAIDELALAPEVGILTVDDPTLWTADLGFDQEFDAVDTALPAGWSWVNQGAAAYHEEFGAGVIRAPGVGGIQWRGIVRSLSGAPGTWEATAKYGFITKATNESGAGIVLRESSSGKSVIFYLYTNNAAVHDIYVYKWTNNSAIGNLAGPIAVTAWRPRYLRIRHNSAASIDFECSEDGVSWYAIASAVDVTGYLTPDQIGFMGYQSDGTAVPWDLACHWFRVR